MTASKAILRKKIDDDLISQIIRLERCVSQSDGYSHFRKGREADRRSLEQSSNPKKKKKKKKNKNIETGFASGDMDTLQLLWMETR